MSQQ
jgi:hypothetical protein